MRKKIFVFMFAIMLIFLLQIKSHAAVSNNEYYTATLIGDYQGGVVTNSDSVFLEKYQLRRSGNSYLVLTINMSKSRYRDSFTQADVDNKKMTTQNLPYFVKTELTSVSGFSALRYVSRGFNSSPGWSVMGDMYQFVSDKYVFWITIDTYNWDDFIDSNQEKELINLFRVKTSSWGKTDLPFTDVRYSDWYYSAAKYAYTNKLISGYNNTTFAPEDKLTRGMLVTILYRMEGMPNNDGISKFYDVNKSEWYAKAIKWAVDNEVVHGYSGTDKFGPEDYILRQDLAGILRNYANYKKKNTNITSSLTIFKDYKLVDSYAKTSMEWAVGAGVITGNGDGTLNPKGNASRAEAAAMLAKYLQRVGR